MVGPLIYEVGMPFELTLGLLIGVWEVGKFCENIIFFLISYFFFPGKFVNIKRIFEWK